MPLKRHIKSNDVQIFHRVSVFAAMTNAVFQRAEQIEAQAHLAWRRRPQAGVALLMRRALERILPKRVSRSSIEKGVKRREVSIVSVDDGMSNDFHEVYRLCAK